MKPPLVSAIIVNWNGEKYLRDCVNSILKQSYKEIEIIMLDNSSTDDSVNIIKKEFSNVRLIENDCNYGFSGGANIGISNSNGKYILILNPDVILSEFFVETIIHKFEEDDSIGFVTGKLYRKSFQKDNEQPGILDSTGHVISKKRTVIDRGQEEIDIGQYDDALSVFSVCGAAPVYRREMLENIAIAGEYFDEDFFAYKEDVDLCWRANLYGWKGLLVPKAVAFHIRAWKPGRRNKIPVFVRFHSVKNRYLMLIKNEFVVNFLKDLPFIILHDLMIFLYILFREPKALKIYISIFKLLPKMMKKRKQIMSNNVIATKEFRRWFH